MSFALRPYQQDALDAVRQSYADHDSVLIELATGLGKTVAFTKLASSWEQGRSLIVCPFIPLVGQASQKLLKETGVIPAIEQADQWSNEEPWARSPFIVGSKQTLCRPSKATQGRPRYERLADIGLVVVDEAHYACTDQYAGMLSWFRDRGAKVLGVTATAKRHDQRAMGQVFDKCVYQYGICEAVDDGWLVSARVKIKQLEKLDLSDVGTKYTPQGKDFNEKQLNEKLENPEVIYEICEAIAQDTRGMKTAVFCSSVDEAQAVAELLVDNYQIKAAWICSDEQRCSKRERSEALESFTTDPDGVSHLCNVGILTTGWDYPGLEAIVMARPTQSKPLYTQIFGRGTRPLEGVVDFEGSTAELRRTRIAESPKPFFRVIDLVDNSLSNKIVTSADVLGGRWTLEATERAKAEAAKAGAPIDFDQAAANAQRELIRIEEEKLRKQRAAKKAQAEFREMEVDPYSYRDTAPARSRTQRSMASDKQLRYLFVLGFKDVDEFAISKSQASRLIGQLKSGVPLDEVKGSNQLKTKSQAPTHDAQEADFNDIFSLFR